MKMNRLFIALSCLALLVTGCKGNTWDDKDYTVTFNCNGGAFSDGTETKTVTVKGGEKVTSPGNPTYQYHDFEYWGVEPEGAEFNFDTPIKDDMTIYANWEQDPCTLFYCTLSGSTFEDGNLNIDLEGYQLEHYNLEKNLVMSDGAKAYVVDLNTQEETRAINFYIGGYENHFGLKIVSKDGSQFRNYFLNITCHFNITVFFNLPDGTYYSESHRSGETLNLTNVPCDPGKGYIFKGWVLHQGDTEIAESVFLDMPEVYVYALVEAKQYNLDLNPDGGLINGSSDIYRVAVTYGETYQLPVPYKQYYDFTGYRLKDNNELITDKYGNSLEPWNYDEGGDTFSVTAEYYLPIIPVTYSCNGVENTIAVSLGETIRPMEVFEVDLDLRYKVDYWTLNGRRVDEILIDGSSYYFVAVIVDRIINLHCYNGDQPVVVQVQYGSGFYLPTPRVESGYRFMGYTFNGVFVTNQWGSSEGEWTYSTEEDVYLETVIDVFIYHMRYYVNGVLAHSEDLDGRYTSFDDPLWEYLLEEGEYFYGWCTEYSIANEPYYINTLGGATGSMDMEGYCHIYGATSNTPYWQFNFGDTNAYALRGVTDDCHETSLTVPETFNGLPIDQIGAYYQGYNNPVFPSELQSLTLSKNVRTFRNCAFKDLRNLTYLDIDSNNPDLKVTNDHKVLYRYSDLKNESYVICAARNITYFSITGELYGIHAYAFQYCSQLTEIELFHLDLDYVGEGAFFGCNGITFKIHGTMEQFNAVFNSSNLPGNYTVQIVE